MHIGRKLRRLQHLDHLENVDGREERKVAFKPNTDPDRPFVERHDGAHPQLAPHLLLHGMHARRRIQLSDV